MDTFEQLLAQLEAIIANAKKPVFSSTDVIINRNEALDIIDRIRINYPELMRQAKAIVDDCENQKQKALEYGNNLIREAEKRRNELLDENDILREATDEAKQVRADAYALRDRVEFDVKCRVDEVLKDSEVTLRDALTLIRNNREDLRNSMREGEEQSQAPQGAPVNNTNA